jgi:pimeloyl-ACP methyl ester carboxylesterase
MDWLPNDATLTVTTVANGHHLRYLAVGAGQPLVLVHPLRTQLEYFQKVIPLLTPRYRVYALDLPGHGHSSAPADASYDEPFFRHAVQQFLDALDVHDVVLAGESIGGTLALTVASDRPDRIARVVALNPYDYGEQFGGGIRRSRNGFIIGLFRFFGPWMPEPRLFLKLVLRGGVVDSAHLPPRLVSELDRAGWRRGHRRAEYRLFKHWRSWLHAASLYDHVAVPVTLVYSEDDWSRPAEREDRAARLGGQQAVMLAGAGHFASLDKPAMVAGAIG